MKYLPCPLAVVLLTAVFGVAAEKPAADAGPDAAPPAPSWLKVIDQGDLDPRLKGYQTPEGIKVEIVAEDPVVVNPVEMAFADDGALYVVERSNGPNPRDAVHVLSPTGKGAFDSDKVVFEDETVHGLLLHDGWLYVCGRGMVRRYRPSKNRGPLDVREVVAQGLQDMGGASIGPDGRLYLSAGAGDNDVEGSDGSRATVLKTGAVLRCRPDGSKMQTYATGFHHPAGPVAFDAAGNAFQADGGRLLHVAEGAEFGERPGALAPMLTAGGGLRGPYFPAWLRPERLAPMLTAGGGLRGLLVYNDSRLPEKFRGLVVCPVRGRGLVLACKVARKGATFEAKEEFDLLKSDDPLFRPRQAVAGPDGAVYVVDSGHGRILRLTWAGTKDLPALPPRDRDAWTRIPGMGDDELIKSLQGDDARDRDQARRELARRGEKERSNLLKIFNDVEQADAARIAALGALEAMWDADVQAAALLVVAKESSADLRRLAADAVGLNAAKGDDDANSGLLRALNDVDPAVRRSVALAMSHVAGAAAPDNLVNAWAFEQNADPYLREGLVRAIENLGARGMERLVALGESGVQKETDKVVEAFTMMRTRPAADAVPRVLENPHLSAAERAALLRSYGNYILDPPLSPAPALDYLKAHPQEEAPVKLAALEALTLPDGNHTDLVKQAVDVLAADAEGARLLGRAYLDHKLPQEMLPQVKEALGRHADKDPAAAELLAELKKQAP